MTLDSNLNPHEEIKNTSKGNCIDKHKRQYKYIFVTLFLLSDLITTA